MRLGETTLTWRSRFLDVLSGTALVGAMVSAPCQARAKTAEVPAQGDPVACASVADPVEARGLAARIGVDPAYVATFAPAMCRYHVSARVEIVSYDINGVVLAPLNEAGRDGRYPLPAILVDGAIAGRLPANVPAELPVTITLMAQETTQPGLPVLRLSAETDAEGDPPRYAALTWRDGAYRPSTTSMTRPCEKSGVSH